MSLPKKGYKPPDNSEKYHEEKRQEAIEKARKNGKLPKEESFKNKVKRFFKLNPNADLDDLKEKFPDKENKILSQTKYVALKELREEKEQKQDKKQDRENTKKDSKKSKEIEEVTERIRVDIDVVVDSMRDYILMVDPKLKTYLDLFRKLHEFKEIEMQREKDIELKRDK
jgi:hypothetical protein